MRMNMCADVPKGLGGTSMIIVNFDAFHTEVHAGHASSLPQVIADLGHIFSAHCHTLHLVRLEHDQTVR